MADFWKSQPRKFCQYCKCWLTDNKPSVEFHERGKNHQENVAAKIQEIRKKSVAMAKQEKKRSKAFSAMEEAAMKAYEEDLKRLAAGSEKRSESPPAEAVPCPTGEAPPQRLTKKEKKPKIHSLIAPPSASFHTSHASSDGSRGADAWIGGAAEDGTLYYYNTVTGESQWEKPLWFGGGSSLSSTGQVQNSSGSFWVEAQTPDGYTYYYNSQTGQSSWEKPGLEVSPPGVDSAAEVATSTPKASADPPQPEEHPDPDPALEPEESGASSKQRGLEQLQGSLLAVEDKSSEGEGAATTDGGEKEAADPEEDPVPVKRVRRNPYGAWERVRSWPEPRKQVDLQLPQVDPGAPQEQPLQVPQEPKVKIKFSERSVTLGDEFGSEVEFRRRKPTTARSRNLRARDTED